MTFAYLILAHKNPDQLQRLTDYLLRNGAHVFIHIDKKSENDFAGFIKKNSGKTDLEIHTQFPVYWGSYNQILATFFLMKKALLQKKIDYVSLISGQDLPIKPIKDFEAFLEKNKKEYFTWEELPGKNFVDNGGLDRFRLYWITDFAPASSWFYSKFNVMLHALQRVFKIYRKIDIRLFGGTNWFSISRAAAEYCTSYVEQNPGFLKRFKNTRCADEIVLQTLLMNSDFKPRCENVSLREIDWKTGPEYPRTYRTPDYERLIASANFFARKFDENTDSVIIDKIYSYISDKYEN